MTERLYYTDCYLASFRARVEDVTPEGRVYLDRTAFYPTSGGQPFDIGSIGAAKISDVIDEGDRIAHVISGPVPSGEVDCRIDWERRFDHMQQHTGQHLLSAVLVDLFNIPTVSFHLGRESSTIDVGAPALTPDQIAAAERRANQIVFENRPVSISFQHAAETLDLRKPSEREGELRIVSIADLDRSACGGTHVRATGEIGPVFIRKVDKIRGNARLEFLCGGRAVQRARADFEALSRVAQVFSAPLDDAPALVAAQPAKLAELEKANRRLATELAQARGRERYADVAPSSDGTRRTEQQVSGPLDDSIRAEAQSFAGGEKAVYLISSREASALLIAVSKDSGYRAGDILKSVLSRAGGRGGGSAQIAQGSVPGPEALDAALSDLRRALGFERAS